MRMFKTKTMFLVVLFCISLQAQSPTGNEATVHLSEIPQNDLNTKGHFKALANKDKITLQWVLNEAKKNVSCRIYRSENDLSNFVLISSSENNSKLSPHSPLQKNNRFCFKDLAVAPGITYWYKLVCTGEDERSVEFGPISASLPVQQISSNRVVANSPRKFRFKSISNQTDLSATTLQLDLPYYIEPHHSTRISIYGAKGERVKTIYKGPMEAGSYRLTWNGDTEKGDIKAQGVFFAVFENNFVREATKLILIQ